MGLILNAKSNGKIVVGVRSDHSKMANLSFETSGHKGFQKELTTEQLEKIEQSHTHANKEILDGITAEKTAAWDAKADKSSVISLQRQTEENKTAIENFKSEVTITYETKEDASAKLNEAKSYTDKTSTELKTLMILPKDDNNPDDSIEYENDNMELNFYVRSRLNTEGHTGLSITATRAEASLMAWKDGANNEIHTTYATKEELSSYSQKPTIITDNTSTTYDVEFLGSTNKIIRLTAPALSELNLKFNNGEYNPDLLINLVFTSGETATHIIPQISFPNTGIINWIGTDCALSEGKSVFTPSANTRYDIVFSFDGSQLVGYVCGYTPATISNG